MSNVKIFRWIFWSVYSTPLFFDSDAVAFCYQNLFKINTIFGTGQHTRNLCNKFSYQSSAIRILCLTVASPKSKDASSRALSITAPCPRIKILGSLVLGSRVPGLRVPGSPFSGPDLRICHFDTMSVLQDFCQKYIILVFTSSKVV